MKEPLITIFRLPTGRIQAVTTPELMATPFGRILEDLINRANRGEFDDAEDDETEEIPS